MGATSNGIDMCTAASEKMAFVMTGSCLERHDGNIIYSTVHFSPSRLPLRKQGRQGTTLSTQGGL